MSDYQDSPRRSGRKRTFTQRYVEHTITEPDDPDLSPTASGSPVHDQGNVSGDEYALDRPHEVFADIQDDSISSDAASDHHASAHGSADGDDSHDDQPNRQSHRPSAKKSTTQLRRRPNRSTPSSRQLYDAQYYKAKSYDLFQTYPEFGTDRESMLQTTYRWSGDHAFPFRLPDHGIGGLRHSFFVTESDLSRNASTAWDWYYERGGNKSLKMGSTLEVLESDKTEPYLPTHHSGVPFVLASPDNQYPENQTPYHIPPYQSFALHSLDNKSERVPNWLINGADTIQCLDWAPCTTDTDQNETAQYLAFSTWPKRKANETSAFAPSKLSPSSIQIWEFSSVANPHLQGYRAFHSRAPLLRLVLCCDWGLVKAMKWCPIPRKPRNDEIESLGLLAVIFTDGAIRLLDVRIPDPAGKEIQFIHWKSAAFESRPPTTVFTCLTWISPSVLAAGCTNGFVAIWNIESNLASEDPHATNATPFFYQSLHATFITNIVSCRPSRPNLLITSSMDGWVRLTDLRHPEIDSANTSRQRRGTIPLIWHEQSQHAVYADESQSLRCHNLRLFFKSRRICEVESSILALASSAFHSAVLIGTSDGSVICTNPLRSLMETRRPMKGADLRQKWFTHEWRRGNTSKNDHIGPDTPSSQPDAPQPLDFPNGLVRITIDHPPQIHATRSAWAYPKPHGEGEQPEKEKKRASRQKASGNTYPTGPDVRSGHSGIPFTTLYEEEAGARCVAWNPDIKCGGWAAAGMASGLVLVSDLAVDRRP